MRRKNLIKIFLQKYVMIKTKVVNHKSINTLKLAIKLKRKKQKFFFEPLFLS